MWFKKDREENYSLFESEEDERKHKKNKILLITFGSIGAVLLILLIFTLCCMYLATDPKNGIKKPPVVNPEF